VLSKEGPRDNSRNEWEGQLRGKSHIGMNRENPTGICTGVYRIVTKSELGLQGTQMANLYTGSQCVYVAGSRVYSKGDD